MRKITASAIITMLIISFFVPYTYANSAQLTATGQADQTYKDVITISGFLGTEANKWVNVRVTDPNNAMDYIADTKTGTNGVFSFTYITDCETGGTFTAVVTGEDAAAQETVTFGYVAPPVKIKEVCTYAEQDKVIIKGRITSGEGKWITVRVTDPNQNIDYISDTKSGTDGWFSFEYLTPSKSDGMLNALLTGEGAIRQVEALVSYSNTFSITGQITTQNNAIIVSGNVTGGQRQIIMKIKDSNGAMILETGTQSDVNGNFNNTVSLQSVNILGVCTIEITSSGVKIPLVKNFSKEATPNAGINYANETLTGLVSGGVYSFNGGASVAQSGTTRTIETSWFGTTVSIVKKGNGTTTVDSDPLKMLIPARPVPPTPDKTDCTTLQNNDGKITNLTANTTSEYKKDSGIYITATTNSNGEITDLTPGSYVIRKKAKTTAFASADSAAVVIGEFTNIKDGREFFDENNTLYYVDFTKGGRLYKTADPNTELTSGPTLWLCRNADYVYFNYNNSLHRININTNAINKVNDDIPFYIVSHGNYIYYSNWAKNGEIYKCNVNTGVSVEITSNEGYDLSVSGNVLTYKHGTDTYTLNL